MAKFFLGFDGAKINIMIAKQYVQRHKDTPRESQHQRIIDYFFNNKAKKKILTFQKNHYFCATLILL